MAIKERNMLRTFSGANDYDLEAKTGESLLIKGIYVSGATSDFATIYIDKTTVGYFRVAGARGGHLFHPLTNVERNKNLLDYLRERGIFAGYPIGEGQKLILKGFQGSGTTCTVVYDKYDAGDITPSQENGTEADSYVFVNYGRPSANPTTTGDVIINSTLNPAEFPAFPFGQDVPARTEIDLLGILASDVGRTSEAGANKSVSRFLKMIRERVVLFDDNKDGIILTGSPPSSDGSQYGSGLSLIGYYSYVDQRYPYLFEEPLTFISGEELNVYITTELWAGSQNLTAEDLEIGLILRIRRAG